MSNTKNEVAGILLRIEGSVQANTIKNHRLEQLLLDAHLAISELQLELRGARTAARDLAESAAKRAGRLNELLHQPGMKRGLRPEIMRVRRALRAVIPAGPALDRLLSLTRGSEGNI